MTDFAALLRALSMGRVRFIVIGGVAAVTHGSARLTADLDVVYDRATDNLEHLVAAMAPHSPYLRGAPAGLLFGSMSIPFAEVSTLPLRRLSVKLIYSARSRAAAAMIGCLPTLTPCVVLESSSAAFRSGG